MAASAYVGNGGFSSTGTKDSSLTPAWTGGSAAAGHLAICQVSIADQGAGHTPPSFVETALQGFRRLGPTVTASGFANNRSSQMRLYYKVLAGGDTAPSFQMTGGTGAGPLLGAVISTFTDVGVIRLSTGNAGDAATLTGTGITTKAANGLICAYTAFSDDAAISANAFAGGGVASVTERYDAEVSARMALQLTTATRATAGASGNFTATPDETDPWTVMVLAMEETDTFPSVSDLDTFNGGALSGDWVADTFDFANSAFTVTGSGEGRAATAFDERAYWNTAQGQADGEVAVQLTVKPATDETVMAAYRVQTPNTAGADGYEMVAEVETASDTIKLFRSDNKTFTTLITCSQELSATDQVGVRYTGSLHEIYVAPATGPKIHVGSVTDATYTSAGYVGMGVKGTTARIGSFLAGPMVVPVATEVAVLFEDFATVQMPLRLRKYIPFLAYMDDTLVVAAGSGTPHEPIIPTRRVINHYRRTYLLRRGV
jgi:hypothetical protein